MKPYSFRFALFSLFFLVLAESSQAQKGAAKNEFCKKWIFTKYKIMGVEYDLSTEAKPDMLHLSKDYTFEAVEEGKKTQGKWQYVENKKTIVLTDDKEEVVKMLKVEKMKGEDMICSIVTDWQYDMTVFMTSEQN